MPERRDLYKILQVDPFAELVVIEAAYRRLAQKYHPDFNKSEDATPRMQEINAAYEILHNPAKRAEYDRLYHQTKSQNSHNNYYERAEQERQKQQVNEQYAEDIRRANQRAEGERLKRETAERQYTEDIRRANQQAEEERQKREKAEEEVENFRQKNRIENKSKTWQTFSKSNFESFHTIRRTLHLSAENLLPLTTLFLSIAVIVVFFALSNRYIKSGEKTFISPEPVLPSTVTSTNLAIVTTVEPPTIQAPTATISYTKTHVLPTNSSTEGSPDVLFSDQFNDETSLETWKIQSGIWNVKNGNSFISTNTGVMVTGDERWSDYNLSIDIYGEYVTDKIVYIRYTDDTNHYGVDFRTSPYNDIVLVKHTPKYGINNLVYAPYQNYNSVWYTLKICLLGSRIEVYVNDRIVISYLDNNEPIVRGKIGIGGMLGSQSKIFFDNVLVTKD